MGGHITSRTEEEDITLEEEAQADGWKGIEGCTASVQVPSLRAHQEDASHL